MATIAMSATVRDNTGKGVARKLRRDGMIPAVMYGVGSPTLLAVNAREFARVFGREGGDHALIDLAITGPDGKNETKGVIVRDYQRDPVNGRMLHCDLYEVQKGHKVTVTVALRLTEEVPVGVREEQGILQHVMHEVEADCLPTMIPDAIEVDASALKVGDSLHVSDLLVPEGVHLHAAEDTTVVSVLAPKLQAEAGEAAEAEGEAGEEGAAAAKEEEGGSGEES